MHGLQRWSEPLSADTTDRAPIEPGSRGVGLLNRGLWGLDDDPPRPDPDFGVLTALIDIASRDRCAKTAALAAGQRSTGAPRHTRTPFRGRTIDAQPCRAAVRDLAWYETLRAAAHLQRHRAARPGLTVCLEPRDLLVKRRKIRPGRLTLFVVDASGSMGGALTALAKRIALTILQRAYVRRERVAMIAFRGRSAELLFEPTNQVELVHRSLERLPLGGTTPLAAGLELAHRVVSRTRLRDPTLLPTLVLISDGRANVGARPGYEKVLNEVERVAEVLRRMADLRILVLETTEEGQNDLRARELVRQLGADRIALARFGLAGRALESALHRVSTSRSF